MATLGLIEYKSQPLKALGGVHLVDFQGRA